MDVRMRECWVPVTLKRADQTNIVLIAKNIN